MISAENFSPSENHRDEEDIITDRDKTQPSQFKNRRLEQNPKDLMSLEDEPLEFIQGEVDVKEQMDRAEAALDTAHRDTQELIDLDKRERAQNHRISPGLDI